MNMKNFLQKGKTKWNLQAVDVAGLSATTAHTKEKILYPGVPGTFKSTPAPNASNAGLRTSKG